jgi:DnaK suppressor protein
VSAGVVSWGPEFPLEAWEKVMSDELSPEQIAELRVALSAQRTELEQLLAMTRDVTRPVDLNEPIGRLTRIDAIQQQGIDAASRHRHDIRLKQVVQALNAMDSDGYGLCRKCEDPISYPRLKARPESPYCLECQDAIDLKYR